MLDWNYSTNLERKNLEFFNKLKKTWLWRNAEFFIASVFFFAKSH